MDDLISRKSVIDLLKKSADRDIEEVVITDKHINLIKDLPVAYDVEKVVAELENPNNYTIVAGKHFTTVDRAIEIVKRGGVE